MNAEQEEFKIRRLPNGRLVCQNNRVHNRTYWSPSMLKYLRDNFATTPNKELSEYFNVSEMTVRRKARELGLVKDREWHLKIALAALKRANFITSICPPKSRDNIAELGIKTRFKKGDKMDPEKRKIADKKQSAVKQENRLRREAGLPPITKKADKIKAYKKFGLM